MKSVFHIKLSKAFLLLLILPILVDQLNGFLVTELGITISISQIFKSFYLFFMIIFLCQYSRRKFFYFLIPCIILLLPVIANLLFYPERIEWIYDDIVFISKLLTFPLSYLFFTALVKKYPDFQNSILHKCSQIIFYIVFIALILSLLGFGNSNYGEVEEGGMSYGYRGYFIAGNELSSLFILIYAYFCYSVYEKYSNPILIIAGLLAGLIIAVLIVTKTALISYLVITITTPFLIKFRNSYSFFSYTRYDKKFFITVFLLIMFSFTLFFTIFYDRIQANIDRLAYNFAKAGELSDFLLSGRNDRFEHSKSLFIDDYTWSEKMIGTGWNYPQAIITSQKLGWGTSEVDYLDILVANGVLGLTVIYLFWIVIMIKITSAFLKKKSNPFNTAGFLAFLLLFFNSFISGHIIYSAMLGFYLGLYLTPIISLKEVNTYN